VPAAPEPCERKQQSEDEGANEVQGVLLARFQDFLQELEGIAVLGLAYQQYALGKVLNEVQEAVIARFHDVLQESLSIAMPLFAYQQ
jgi:hypothetical protein